MKHTKPFVVIISDPHGTENWIDAVNFFEENYVKGSAIVCLGDWFDNWKNNWGEVDQIDNLNKWLDTVDRLNDKYGNGTAYNLLGNHDLGYLTGLEHSGYQKFKAIDIKEFLEKNIDRFDICAKIGDVVYSHAGITNSWLELNGFDLCKDDNDLIRRINAALYILRDYKLFDFVWKMRCDLTGDNVYQGPLWVRPQSLVEDRHFNKQVVGHTAILEDKPFVIEGEGFLFVFADNKERMWSVKEM